MFRSIRYHLTSGRGIAATYALIPTIGLGLSVTAPAAASDGQDQQSPKPTIVFVHGGWADSSSWNQEITNLERRGYSVIAPANPLRDLANDLRPDRAGGPLLRWRGDQQRGGRCAEREGAGLHRCVRAG